MKERTRKQRTPEDAQDTPQAQQHAQQRFTRVRTGVHMDELRSRQDRKRHRRMVAYILLLAGATVIFLAVCFFLFFRISEIRVEGNEIYSAEQILEQMPFAVGENLFSFDTAEAEGALRKALPYIGNVEIKRSLPSLVTVEVSERRIELSLAIGEEAYLLSGDLQVMGRIGGGEITEGVTRLRTGDVERCVVGERVVFRDGRVASDLEELYRCLSENGMMGKIRSIDMTSRFDITINYEGRFTVYLASIENMEIKIRFLGGIVAQLAPDDRGSIDLANHREAAVRLEETPAE